MTCFACDNNALAELPPREDIVRTAHWRLVHAYDSALPGWLVLVSARHDLSLHDLDEEAHVELGLLQGRVSRALETLLQAPKTYVMFFAEALTHVHLHLVPRMPDQPEDRIGPGVFGYLGADESERVPVEEADRIALALRELISTEGLTRRRSG
jgi:diadenosine tetraphosphate (Ap4A) HIT family hydrolase